MAFCTGGGPSGLSPPPGQREVPGVGGCDIVGGRAVAGWWVGRRCRYFFKLSETVTEEDQDSEDRTTVKR